MAIKGVYGWERIGGGNECVSAPINHRCRGQPHHKHSNPSFPLHQHPLFFFLIFLNEPNPEIHLDLDPILPKFEIL